MSNPYAPPPPGREPRDPREDDRRGRRPGAGAGRGPGERSGEHHPQGTGQHPGEHHPQGTGQHPSEHRPQGTGEHRPGPRGPARPPAPSVPATPPDPALVAVAGRRMRAFLVALVVAILTERLPLPWQLTTVAAALVAAALGARAVHAALKARMPRGLVVLAGAGVGISLMVAFSMVTVAMFWPLPLEQQTCMSRAITITAQNECTEAYRQGIVDRLGTQGGTRQGEGLLDRLVPTVGQG